MSLAMNINAPTTPLAVSTSSARAAVTGKGTIVLIDNTLASNTDCYVKSGDVSVVAATTDTHIAAGEKAPYEIDPAHTHIAAITASGTTNLRIQRGEGY